MPLSQSGTSPHILQALRFEGSRSLAAAFPAPPVLDANGLRWGRPAATLFGR